MFKRRSRSIKSISCGRVVPIWIESLSLSPCREAAKKLISILKGQYLARSPLQWELFPILLSDFWPIYYYGSQYFTFRYSEYSAMSKKKRRLCSVTMTFRPKILDLIWNFWPILLWVPILIHDVRYTPTFWPSNFCGFISCDVTYRN